MLATTVTSRVRMTGPNPHRNAAPARACHTPGYIPPHQVKVSSLEDCSGSIDDGTLLRDFGARVGLSTAWVRYLHGVLGVGGTGTLEPEGSGYVANRNRLVGTVRLAHPRGRMERAGGRAGGFVGRSDAFVSRVGGGGCIRYFGCHGGCVHGEGFFPVIRRLCLPFRGLRRCPSRGLEPFECVMMPGGEGQPVFVPSFAMGCGSSGLFTVAPCTRVDATPPRAGR